MFLPARNAAPAARDGARRPNLLLLVWDTCRSDRLQPYGYGRETSPGLARLAEQSLVFEDSLSVSSFTFTSHLSMLTGVHPTTHGAHLLDMRFDPARAESIAQILARNGYRTGAFVGTDVLAGRTGMRTGFEVYDDAVDPTVCDTHAWRLVHDVQSLVASIVPALRFDGRPHWIQDFQRPASEVLQRARAFIERDDPRPWFCFVNLYDVHWPYLPEGEGAERLVRPYDGAVDGFLFRSDAWRPDHRMSDADKRHVADLYEAEIFDLDREVERFLDGLQLDQGGTAVLVTADHGEGLGEHDTWNHDGVREPQVRVPLVLRPPAADPVGRHVRAPVSGVDVAPTLLGLAGIAAPAGMEGVDVSVPELATERLRWIDDRDHLSLGEHCTALYRGPFKLVRKGEGDDARYALYELEHDPVGVHDVQSEYPEVYADLVRCMEERQRAIAPLDRGDSSGSAAALQALGYAGE
jgi:arylsulfatase A-like enzyme